MTLWLGQFPAPRKPVGAGKMKTIAVPYLPAHWLCEAHSLRWLVTYSSFNDIAPHTPYMFIKNLGSGWIFPARKRSHKVQQKAGYQSYPVPRCSKPFRPESASASWSTGISICLCPWTFHFFLEKRTALECGDMLQSRTAHVPRPVQPMSGSISTHTHPVSPLPLPLPLPFPFPLFFPLLFPLPLPPLPPPSKACPSLASAVQ